MDLLTHILSGVAAGTVVAGFSSKSRRNRAATVAFGGFGGMFPDFDVISMWSGFDTTFGRLFNLKHTGTGDIWWWNNYDIFLIVVGVIFINTLLLFSHKSFKTNLKRFTLLVFAAGVLMGTYQIKTRGFDFSTSRGRVCEEKSKEIQKEILGHRVFSIMEGT